VQDYEASTEEDDMEVDAPAAKAAPPPRTTTATDIIPELPDFLQGVEVLPYNLTDVRARCGLPRSTQNFSQGVGLTDC
jgi:hypothetical protein